MPYLMLILENSERRIYPLERKTVLVGRDDDVEIKLPSNSVSGKHASIFFEDGHFVVLDNGSTNGTLINGKRITRQIIKQHDMLRFGESVFLYCAEGMTGETSESRGVEIIMPKAGVSVSTATSMVASPSLGATRMVSAKSPGRKTVAISNTKAHTRPFLLAQTPTERRSAAKKRQIRIIIITVSFPVAILLSIFLTLYSLPLSAREAVVLSKGFQAFTPKLLIRSFLFRDGDVDYQATTLQKDAPFRSSIAASRPTRLIVKFQFQGPTTSKLLVKAQIGSTEANATPVIAQTIQIPQGTEFFTLFSVALNPGNYNFSFTCEQSPSEHFLVPVKVLVFREYE
jgi:pSer/pThr/pTyr-binding forkhead associated (FHA) protein